MAQIHSHSPENGSQAPSSSHSTAAAKRGPHSLPTLPSPLPYELALHLVETALDRDPALLAGLDPDTFLSAFKMAEGRLDELGAVHKTLALALMAAGAAISSDPAITGPGAPKLTSISTSTFTPSPSLRFFGTTRSHAVTTLSRLAWSSLESSSLLNSLDGMGLLYFIAERFEHPQGPKAKMLRVSEGIRVCSDVIDDEENNTIDQESRAFSFSSGLIVVATEEAFMSGVHPTISDRVWQQFVYANPPPTLSSLPNLSLIDLSPAFSSDPTGLPFVKLYGEVVAPIQQFSSEIERVYGRDIVDPTPSSVQLLRGLIEAATNYIDDVAERILSDKRLESDPASSGNGYITNSWTRAFLKNILVQRTRFSTFVFAIDRNLGGARSGVVEKEEELSILREESRKSVLEQLSKLSGDVLVLQRVTRTLDDIHVVLAAYSKALDHLDSSLVTFLSELEKDEVDRFRRVFGFVAYYDSKASHWAEVLEISL